VKFGISFFFLIFDQFSLLFLEMCRFSFFNQILLSLFKILNVFYDNI